MIIFALAEPPKTGLTHSDGVTCGKPIWSYPDSSNIALNDCDDVVMLWPVLLLYLVGVVTSQPWLDPNLPTAVVPLNYSLSFLPDFYYDHAVFYGNARIELQVAEDTNIIIIHYKQMNISQTTLLDANGDDVAVTHIRQLLLSTYCTKTVSTLCQ